MLDLPYPSIEKAFVQAMIDDTGQKLVRGCAFVALGAAFVLPHDNLWHVPGALACLGAAVAIQTYTDPGRNYVKAHAKLREGDVAGAIAAFKKAHGVANAKLGLAESLRRAGDWTWASKAYREAKQECPCYANDVNEGILLLAAQDTAPRYPRDESAAW